MDQIIYDFFKGIHSDTATPILRDITALGGPMFMVLLMLISTVIFIRNNMPGIGLLNIFIFLCALLTVEVIKRMVDRERPPLFDPHIYRFETDPSFPSGHSAISICVYAMLAIPLATCFPHIGKFIIWLSILIPMCIGVSRLYLGEHWVSDVVIGWVIGFLFVELWGFILMGTDVWKELE